MHHMMLSVLLLGPPQLLLDGRSIAVTRRKSRALIYYLAAQPAPLAREQLLAFFWPDLDRPAAQVALRTTLHGLRKALGAGLEATDVSIALAPDVDVDARDFERTLAAPSADTHQLSMLLDRYRGEFLAGFALPDVLAFEDWLSAERERYRRLALRGLSTLAHLHEDRGEFPAAIDAIERALALDPLQEEAQRTAMRLRYLAGDRAGAIRRFEHLRQLLDDELGVPPMAETQALYDAIITDNLERDAAKTQIYEQTQTNREPSFTPSPLHPFTPSPLPFVGRAAELSRLRDLAAAHRLVLIEGEPGIGKTRLAEEFLRTFGTLALAGAARELEHALPYQPVIEALRGLLARDDWPTLRAALELPTIWLAEVARLLPELAMPGDDGRGALIAHLPALPDAAESRLWEGVNQFLRALGRRRPVTLFLDDLHWADASTLALLGYLARQPHDAPIAFLATTRPVGPRAPLAALVQALGRGDSLARLPLARLGTDDVTRLARSLSPTYVYPLADWLLRNSEGNPYILAELVRHARESELLRGDGALNLPALSDTPIVPTNVYSLAQSRLARLSKVARRLLDAAVAIGREFDFAVAARAAGLAEGEALDALDELRAATLIAPLSGEHSKQRPAYVFDHTLTMEVAYREIGEPRHRLLHRRVAEAMEQLDSDRLDEVAGLLASHFAEGGAPKRAAQYAFRAGQRAAALAAWAEAASFYEQALAGTDPGQHQGEEGARRLTILMALGQVRLAAGAAAQAGAAFRAAQELAEARGERDGADRAKLELARAFLAQNRYAQMIALARQLRENPAYLVDAELLWGTALSLEGADLADATAHLNAAAAGCAAQSNPLHLAHINFELGSVAAQQGDLLRAIEHYRAALVAAEQTDEALTYRILAHNNLAYHLLLLGDPAAAEHARIGLGLAQEQGALGVQTFLLSTLGEIAMAQSDLAAAERHFAEGLALAERLDIPERIAGLTANLGLLAQRRGRTDLARKHLAFALASASAIGARHLSAQIRVWLAALLPPAEAHKHLAAARAFAAAGHRRLLLEQIDALERQPDS
jgi:DNA-binding SARP family transcriptional activator/tetratricopeptide (TPR) repeat protein